MITTRRAWLTAAAVFALALATYWFSAQLLGRTRTPQDAYFNLLADAFLHGRLYLAAPPVNYDLTMHGGRWYVPFPPLPALLLLPFVAARGLAGTNTILFGAAAGAANVALAFLLLDALAARGWSQLKPGDNLWLTALFGLGSVHWYMSTLGTVWFLAQLCTVTFLLAALWLATAAAWRWSAGVALAAAMLGRPHIALALPLLFAIEVQRRGGLAGGRRAWAGWAIGALGPVAVSGALLLGYNAARFGSPLDFGYLTQNVARELKGNLHTYGQFSLHYLPHNIWSMLLALPSWQPKLNALVPDLDGMSLLLTTPALAAMAWARRPRALVIGAWAAIGLILIPLLTYYNTGWWQFGYRFSLDFMPAALILLALACGRRVNWPLRALIIFGIIVNAGGAWWFQNPLYFS